jgi:hypothetical protein
MTTTPTYDMLLSEITDTLERQVLTLLMDNAGKRLTREHLVYAIFGKIVADGKLANNPDDRKIRECIERLQQRKYPILSSSGRAGYIMAIDDGELDTYVAELETRQRALHEKVKALRESRYWIPFIKAHVTRKPVEQLSMFAQRREMP